MRYALVFLLIGILLLGCVGGNQPKNGTTGIQLPPMPGIAQACTPAYTFSEPAAGVLSKTTEVVANAECAGGVTLTAKIDGVAVASAAIATNDSQQVKLEVPATKDGVVKLTVDSGAEPLLSKDWTVKPLGSEDISGLDADPVSFKEWRAMAMDVQNTITPSKVKIYMKRLEWKTQPATVIAVEIRKDDNGNPGDRVAGVERPINITTLSNNWVSFDLGNPTLPPGRYWITVKIKQTEDVSLVSDVLQIHNVPVSKQAPGNDYTREMKLSVDGKTGIATETQWRPLAYDKAYSVVLTTG